MIPAFPKPSQMKKQQVAVRIFRDGREVCNLNIKAGRDEYDSRKLKMHQRQGGLCCLCGLRLAKKVMAFEHQDGRGMNGSHRDDRTEKDGKPYNGVAHWDCNSEKGSKRTPYVIDVP
jgi:hypothetical protein